MNTKRFWVMSLIVYIFVFLFTFVCHHTLLGSTYVSTASVWRPEAEQNAYFAYYLLGQAIFVILFCYIYTRLPNLSGVNGGLRYGFWLGLLLAIPASLLWFSILPIPAMLAVWWTIIGVVQACIMGLLCGALYKPKY